MKLCSNERVYYLSSVKSWYNSFGIFSLHREKFLFPWYQTFNFFYGIIMSTQLRCSLFKFIFCRTLETCQLSDEYKLSFTTDSGCFHLKDTNRIYENVRNEMFTIKEGDPTTAKVTMQGDITLKKEDQIAEQGGSGHERWEARVQALSEMWCDEQFFYVKSQLTAWHNSEECFDRTWTKKIERFYV